MIDRLIRREEENIIEAVTKLRHDLDAIESAIAAGLRIPSSISGDPFFTTRARDLEQSCIKRQAYYDAELQS